MDAKDSSDRRGKVGLISTGVGVVSAIQDLVHQMNDGIDVYNIVDDSVIRSIAENGDELPESVLRRVVGYCEYASEIGVDAVLVTCSSISEIADLAQRFVKVPVFKIDAPMARAAVGMASRDIGVAATLTTTMNPTSRLIQSVAEASRKKIAVHMRLCEGAFEALQRGDTATHDRIVVEAVGALLAECEVVVLAQASMAGAASSLSAAEGRILTSPRSGVKQVVDYVESLAS